MVHPDGRDHGPQPEGGIASTSGGSILRSVGSPRAPVPAMLTDEAIVARVCAGEQDLFELLMLRHNPHVYRASRAILHDDGETEDVMQDAYARAYEHLRDFEG